MAASHVVHPKEGDGGNGGADRNDVDAATGALVVLTSVADAAVEVGRGARGKAAAGSLRPIIAGTESDRASCGGTASGIARCRTGIANDASSTAVQAESSICAWRTRNAHRPNCTTTASSNAHSAARTTTSSITFLPF